MPEIAAVGSCCLVGVICSGNLYIANLGDSRAVLGRLVKATGEVLPIQLSSEHNVCIESVGQELHSEHPDDSQMVVLKPNVCRVRGLIQGAIIPSVLSSRTISKTNNELRTINLSAPIAVARSVHYTGVVGNSRTRTCIEMWRMAAGRKRWRRAGRKPGRGAGKKREIKR